MLCHASAQPLVRVETPSRARVFADADGRRRLAMITPIYNEPSCRTAACHAHPETAARARRARRGARPGAGRPARGRDARAASSDDGPRGAADLGLPRGLHRACSSRGRSSAWSRRTPRSGAWTSSTRSRSPPAASCRSWRARSTRCATGSARRWPRSTAPRSSSRPRSPSAPSSCARRTSTCVQADRLASLGQLAASVAHEINNPLSGVLNYSALMGRILKDDGIPQRAGGGVPRLPRPGHRADGARRPHRLRPAGVLAALEAAARARRPQRDRAHDGLARRRTS